MAYKYLWLTGLSIFLLYGVKHGFAKTTLELLQILLHVTAPFIFHLSDMVEYLRDILSIFGFEIFVFFKVMHLMIKMRKYGVKFILICLFIVIELDDSLL